MSATLTLPLVEGLDLNTKEKLVETILGDLKDDDISILWDDKGKNTSHRDIVHFFLILSIHLNFSAESSS